MKTTTLNRIREHSPCRSSWTALLKHLNKTAVDDEPLPFKLILDVVGIDDTLWCARSAPEYSPEWRLFAVFCARQVSHLLTDPRLLSAIEIAERFALGLATEDELRAAYAAAEAAYDAAEDSRDAARDAAAAALNAATPAASVYVIYAAAAARDAAAKVAARDAYDAALAPYAAYDDDAYDADAAAYAAEAYAAEVATEAAYAAKSVQVAELLRIFSS
jgi:hypothetical protein